MCGKSFWNNESLNVHNTKTLKSPDPRDLCLQSQDFYITNIWTKCKMCDNTHQLIWWLKIHKRIWYDDFLWRNKQITCGETHAVAAEQSLILAPIVLTPRSMRFWSVSLFTCLTSISSETNVSAKFLWRYHCFWEERDCDMILGTSWTGPKRWEMYCRLEKSTGVCYIAMYGLNHVKIGFPN